MNQIFRLFFFTKFLRPCQTSAQFSRFHRRRTSRPIDALSLKQGSAWKIKAFNRCVGLYSRTNGRKRLRKASCWPRSIAARSETGVRIDSDRQIQSTETGQFAHTADQHSDSGGTGDNGHCAHLPRCCCCGDVTHMTSQSALRTAPIRAELTLSLSIENT